MRLYRRVVQQFCSHGLGKAYVGAAPPSWEVIRSLFSLTRVLPERCNKILAFSKSFSDITSSYQVDFVYCGRERPYGFFQLSWIFGGRWQIARLHLLLYAIGHLHQTSLSREIANVNLATFRAKLVEPLCGKLLFPGFRLPTVIKDGGNQGYYASNDHASQCACQSEPCYRIGRGLSYYLHAQLALLCTIKRSWTDLGSVRPLRTTPISLSCGLRRAITLSPTMQAVPMQWWTSSSIRPPDRYRILPWKISVKGWRFRHRGNDARERSKPQGSHCE